MGCVNDILTSNNWRIAQSPGDGHCLDLLYHRSALGTASYVTILLSTQHGYWMQQEGNSTTTVIDTLISLLT